jgi:membrane associated rhomboid family serine protease
MFRLPRITKHLLLINIAAYLLLVALAVMTSRSASPVDLNDIFGLHFFLAPDFRIYQLITYMFMHGGTMHLFFNMFALWMFGCVVENVWGPRKFLFYYIICGVGAGLFQEAAQFFEFLMLCRNQIPGFAISDIMTVAHNSGEIINAWTTVGASGAVYAILLAFGMTFPEQHIFIFPLPIPIKAKWFVIFYAGIELFAAMSTTSDGVAHIAHLGGMFFGFFLIRYWAKHPTSGYGSWRGEEFFRNMWHKKRDNEDSSLFGRRQSRQKEQPKNTNPDWDYNKKKHDRQKEIDAILDKIRKSGYDSLTNEEKQKLFDGGKDDVN